MIVPCDTNMKITMTFGGTDFDIPSSAYILGAVSNVPGCLGAFAVLDQLSCKQSLFYCPARRSHVEQQPFASVPPSCKLFTLNSTKEIRQLDLPRSHRAGSVGISKRDGIDLAGRLSTVGGGRVRELLY